MFLHRLFLGWTDKYGQVWVITGPVFLGKYPAMWLGQDGENKVAIPDALFKIVIRETDNLDKVKTLVFIIPVLATYQKELLCSQLLISFGYFLSSFGLFPIRLFHA